MNLISFNVSNNHVKLNKKLKKIILFDNSCKDNKIFNKFNTKFKVAEVYESNKNKTKISKLKNFTKLYFFFLKYLSKKLNNAHKKKYSTTFWNFLINQWLYYNLKQAYVRWETYLKIKKKYKISKFYKILLNEEDYIPDNSLDSRIMQVNFNKLNFEDHFLITKIIEFINDKKIQIISLKNTQKIKAVNKPIYYDKFLYKSLKNKIFIYKLQLPIKQKIKLSFFYKFFNIKLSNKKFYLSKINSLSFDRKKIFTHKNKKNFKNFFKSYIKFSLPKIFLENFNELNKKLDKLNFPNEPKNILTSYPQFDEIFKLFCAKNLKKSNILIFQHGYDNIFKYENTLYKFYPVKYLSWGKDSTPKKNHFYFTKHSFSKKKFNYIDNNKIQLVLTTFREREDRLPFGYAGNFNANKHLYETSLFLLKNLNKKIKNKVDVKIQSLNKYPIIENSLKKKFPLLNFISMDKTFGKLIDNYNLNIFLTIGTPLFEAAYFNRPFILIYNKQIEFELDNKFNKFINKLIKNNICFTDNKKALKFINQSYLNLDKWWNSNNIQNLIDDFSNSYCRRHKSFFNEFNKILK